MNQRLIWRLIDKPDEEVLDHPCPYVAASSRAEGAIHSRSNVILLSASSAPPIHLAACRQGAPRLASSSEVFFVLLKRYTHEILATFIPNCIVSNFGLSKTTQKLSSRAAFSFQVRISTTFVRTVRRGNIHIKAAASDKKILVNTDRIPVLAFMTSQSCILVSPVLFSFAVVTIQQGFNSPHHRGLASTHKMKEPGENLSVDKKMHEAAGMQL